MARQEHEHGLLGDVGQADARHVPGGVEAQGRPEADTQARGLQAEDLADGAGGGVDDPVAPHPELLGQSQDVAGEDDRRGGSPPVVVVQEVGRGQQLRVVPRIDEPEPALARVRLVEPRLQAGDVLDEDVLAHAVRGDRSEIRGDELAGPGRGDDHREQVVARDGSAVETAEGGLPADDGADPVLHRHRGPVGQRGRGRPGQRPEAAAGGDAPGGGPGHGPLQRASRGEGPDAAGALVADELDAPAPPAAFASASGGEAPAVPGGAPIPYLGVSEPDTNAPASSANAPIMPVDLRPTGDSPMPGASTAATVDSAATRRSPKRKVAAGIGVVLLVVLAVLGFFVYKHSREEAARDAIVATTQSMVACDEGLQRLDSVAELNHSYLLPDKTDTAKADKTDTAKRGLDEASSSLTDARRSLESARSDGWALDDDARHTLDVLQDGLDARRGMIDAGSQLVNSLVDVQSAAEELAHLMADSSLFLDSSDNAVNTLNSSSRYIDQIDTTTMINDLESAKKYQASMSDDLRAAREKLPSANLSSYQTVVERASTMITALQDILDAIQAQDAAKANDAATALNAAIDSFNDARRGLPSLAEGIESLVPDKAKDYAKDYRAQRERVVETLAELGGNPLTSDVVNGSKLLQGSHA